MKNTIGVYSKKPKFFFLDLELFIMPYIMYFFLVIASLINLYDSYPFWIDSLLVIIAIFVFEALYRNLYLKRQPKEIIIGDNFIILLYFFEKIKIEYSINEYTIIENDNEEDCLLKIRIKYWRFPLVIYKSKYNKKL